MKITATLFREPPPTASGQRDKILRLLRDAAKLNQGVSGDCLRYEHNLRQAPSRIWELKNDFGYVIRTEQDPATRCAIYFFVSDPPEGWRPPAKQVRLRLRAETPLETTSREAPADWFTRATGKPRPTQADVSPEGMPLFAEGRP